MPSKTFRIANEMEDYDFTFQVQYESKNINSGFVISPAKGIFTFDNGTLSVEFDGLNGKGSAGGWNNSSFQVIINETTFQSLFHSRLTFEDMSTRAIIKSRQLYNRPILATMVTVDEKVHK